MSKLYFSLLLSLFFTLGLSLGSPLSAQAAQGEERLESTAEEGDGNRLFGPAHRRELYEANRLQHRRALLYSLALPGLGNFYAEQYALGVVALSGVAFMAMFLGYGFVNSNPEVIRLGIITGALTYLGSGAFAAYGVSQYNEGLRRSLHLEASSPPALTPGLTLGWTF